MFSLSSKKLSSSVLINSFATSRSRSKLIISSSKNISTTESASGTIDNSPTEAQKRLNILMLGPPGVGKGTYSRLMTKDFKIPLISSGDELRKVLASAEGEKLSELKNILKEGKLADDEFMLNFMKERFEKPECADGVILDGFPRNTAQAVALDKLLKINLVIKIDLNEEVLIQKLLGRRVCRGCGKNYNFFGIYTDKYELDPLTPKDWSHKCDECKSNLYQREDDNLATIKDRIDVYNSLTKPLEEFYGKQNILYTFEMRRGIKDYYLIKDFITEWKQKNNFL
jgi:adenylate kinase